MDIKKEIDIKELTVSAVITRADGTIENHGVIGSYYRNPIKRYTKKIVDRIAKRLNTWRRY